MESGQDPSHFWRLTLREISVILDGAVARMKRKRDEDITLAWHVEALARQKKLQPLNALLKKQEKTPTGQRMTATQIEATVRGWLGSRHRKK